jgi:hypothetical protein
MSFLTTRFEKIVEGGEPYEHITHCSPCYAEFLRANDDVRAKRALRDDQLQTIQLLTGTWRLPKNSEIYSNLFTNPDTGIISFSRRTGTLSFLAWFPRARRVRPSFPPDFDSSAGIADTIGRMTQ